MGSRIAAYRVFFMGLFFILAVVGWRAWSPPSTREEDGTRAITGPVAGAGSRYPKDVLGVPRNVPDFPGMPTGNGGYWYLPYAVVNDAQGVAMVEALEAQVRQGKPFPETLTVPEGKGAGGRDTLYAIRPGVEHMFLGDINNPGETAVSESDIPLIISQPHPGDVSADVLYMDGHLASVRVGAFPLTPGFLAALSEIDPPTYTEEGGHGH